MSDEFGDFIKWTVIVLIIIYVLNVLGGTL